MAQPLVGLKEKHTARIYIALDYETGESQGNQLYYTAIFLTQCTSYVLISHGCSDCEIRM